MQMRMSVLGPLRHVAARSLTVAFGAKRTFGGRPPQRIYEFAAGEATFEPNLNAHIFDLDGAPPIQSRRRASQSLGETSGLLGFSFPLFPRHARHVKSCEKIAVFAPLREGLGAPAEPLHPRLPNGTGRASGAVPTSHPMGNGTGTTLWPQVPVAALIRLSPEWAKSCESRSTMPDRDHSFGLGRRLVQPQTILHRAPLAEVAQPRSCSF
jgi:hypothetical protein